MPATEWSRFITELEILTREIAYENSWGREKTSIQLVGNGLRIVVESDHKRHQWVMPWHWLRGERSERDAGAFMLRQAVKMVQREFAGGANAYPA